eukprot:9839612-Prorocentrum_lima.AAC.1
MDVRLSNELTTGRRKDYAFVQFERPDDAHRAIERMNGAFLRDKQIRVVLARNNPKPVRNPQAHGGARRLAA